jgi:hypothetical protein
MVAHVQVMEMKFDITFASDEERLEFAKAQREKIAKILGIPVNYIEISEVHAAPDARTSLPLPTCRRAEYLNFSGRCPRAVVLNT